LHAAAGVLTTCLVVDLLLSPYSSETSTGWPDW